jgi:hypothetical protein
LLKVSLLFTNDLVSKPFKFMQDHVTTTINRVTLLFYNSDVKRFSEDIDKKIVFFPILTKSLAIEEK